MKYDLPPDLPYPPPPDKPAQAGFVVSSPRMAKHWATDILYARYHQYSKEGNALQMRRMERCMLDRNISIPEL
ncbi:hypothetical protein [Chromobacterium vaccinii]|uniref:hypothetical protein n=1 Tax=Chromobacterium vaccinii TaxID=1108595 RepID=UPI001185B69C|nr:hypothetical protein [Chromobacterium vaccinii]